MRALCLTATGADQHLDVIEVAPPVLRGPTEVRIGIRAAALNHIDLWVANAAPGLKVPTLPHIVGSDGAGIVLAARLLGLPVKERVAGIDLFRELMGVCAKEGFRLYERPFQDG